MTRVARSPDAQTTSGGPSSAVATPRRAPRRPMRRRPTHQTAQISNSEATGQTIVAVRGRMELAKNRAMSVEVCSDLPARRYHMISLPVTPPDNSVEAILGDVISGTEAYDWRLGRWNPSSETYVDVSSLTPGNAYWLITTSRVSIDIPGVSIAPTTDGYYSVALSSG